MTTLPGIPFWGSVMERKCRKCAVYGVPLETTLVVYARRTKHGIRFLGRCRWCRKHMAWVKAEKVPVYIQRLLELRLELNQPQQGGLFGETSVQTERVGGDLT